MSASTIKLSEIVGREVPREEAFALSEYLLACLTHVTNARPLFVLFDTDTETLEWSAGGADFYDVLCHAQAGFDHNDIASLDILFERLGIAPKQLDVVKRQFSVLAPGASMSMLSDLDGAGQRTYRMVMRRRREPHGHLLQFSLFDISAFRKVAARTQDMARGLIASLESPGPGEANAMEDLKEVVSGLESLFTLSVDAAIAEVADGLSVRVTSVSETMVRVLRGIEQDHDSAHWQPEDLNPGLRPEISVHSVPVRDWRELHDQVVVMNGPEPVIQCIHGDALRNAYDFVSHATNILVISPQPDEVFILNGPAQGRVSHGLDDFVRTLGVEENSRRTARAFFENLPDRSALGVFAVRGENMEAWGRPGPHGGWQAMLSPAPGRAVDVRGLFHGLKNLLLHLQVLYVVKTRADVEQVRAGLEDTAIKISDRLRELECIAHTGRRSRSRVDERVLDWLENARRIARDGENVIIESQDVEDLTVPAVPGDMDDTMQELVRNAFQHGAKTVRLSARVDDAYLCLKVVDDGPGVSEDKLDQLRGVIAKRVYDAALSTRQDGTGNGFLAAVNAVGQFVDGRMDVAHGTEGRGLEIRISMKLAA